MINAKLLKNAIISGANNISKNKSKRDKQQEMHGITLARHGNKKS